MTKEINHRDMAIKNYTTRLESAYLEKEKEVIEREKVEEEILKLNEELEERVAERTKQYIDANMELKDTLDELVKTQKHLVGSEKMSSLGGLVAGIAHEVNTPVGIGVTAASHLEKKTKDFINYYEEDDLTRERLEDFIAVTDETSRLILNNLRRASELIESFKKVAVDQSSQKRRQFNLKQYLGEILLSLKPKLKKTNHTVEINCADDINLDSYPGAFSQVFSNLIINSLVHAYNKTDTGKIIIYGERNEDNLVLKYSDNGKGISKENLDKIFEPFFTTQRGSGGSGLGLHLIYNIVTQSLHGKITCDSETDKGTTFIITIPSKHIFISEGV